LVGANWATQRLDKIVQSERRKNVIWGIPKESGKTTLALSGTGTKLHLMYDLGNVFAPPGKDPAEIYVRSYPPIDPDIDYDSMRWGRPKNVGERIIKDLWEIRTAFLEGRQIKFSDDEEEIPLPDTLNLDGMVAMREHITDWILATSPGGKKEPDDFTNRYALWGFRLDKMTKLLNIILPLPCNVNLITWQSELTRQVRTPQGIVNEKIGEFVPDFGGQLDVYGPGKVDSSLYCFHENKKWYVRIKSNGIIHGVGVRGRYDGEEVVEVTVKEDGSGVSPWDSVFSYKQ